SMPSTVIPSAILPRMSETAGCWSASSFARARTDGVSSISRQGRAHRPCSAAPTGRLSATLKTRTSPTVSPKNSARALVRDVDDAYLLDRVAEELDPQRVLLGRREHVEQPAADGELAAFAD